MGKELDKPDTRPALAGDLESFSDVDTFTSVFQSEHEASPYGDSGVFQAADALVSDGMAAHLPLNPEYLNGDIEVFRPFPGIGVFYARFETKKAKELQQISRKGAPEAELAVRFFHGGHIRYRFGSKYFYSDDAPGLVSYKPEPGEFDFLLKDGEPMHVTTLSISEDGEREVWHRLGIPPPAIFHELRTAEATDDRAFQLPDSALFQQLSASFCLLPNSGFARLTLLRLKVGELFCLLGDHQVSGKRHTGAEVPFSEVRRLSQARAILEASCESPPSIAELSAQVGLNRRKLTEGFKSVYGDTVGGYSLELRMRKGYQLLKETEQTVNDIAISCGYEHANNFTIAFRRRFGCSPSSVRHQK